MISVSNGKPKKRGRRPKGGIIVAGKQLVNHVELTPNVIIQLKCKCSEIEQLIGNSLSVEPTTYNPHIHDISKKIALNH